MEFSLPALANLCIEHILHQVALFVKLHQLVLLQATAIRIFIAAAPVEMATDSPPTTRPQSPARKLLVVRFLDAHLEYGGIEQHGYEMLYQMVLIISTMGQELHHIIQSDIAHATTIEKMQWYAACLLEGCEAFRKCIHLRATKAQEAAELLPELENVRVEDLDGQLRIWRATLRTLHVPTGNDARLFRHVFAHYDDVVYRTFLQLHRRQPDSLIWTVNEQLTAVPHLLNEIQGLCRAADSIVEHLDEEYRAASERLKRWAEQDVQSTTDVPVAGASRPRLRVDVETAAPAAQKTSPIPDQPPRLPPLPFQRSTAEDTLMQVKSAPLELGDMSRGPTGNKSFSTVEDQVSHRKHFRSATMANVRYVTDSAGIGLGIAPSEARQPCHSPAIGIRRKDSVGNVPRVFTGSFSELESDVHRLRLHKVKTPEAQLSTPVPVSPILEGEDPVKVRGFGDALNTPSLCPSPVTLLHRREALVSKDVQWESRVVNGELVRSRRPSERMQLQQPHTMDDRSVALEGWLSQDPQAERSAPSTPGSAVKRGLLRQREHTL